MRKTTGLLLGSIGLLVASLWTTWLDTRATASANALIAELDRRTRRAADDTRVARERIAVKRKEQSQLEAALAKHAAKKTPEPASASLAQSFATIEWSKRWEKLLQDPAYQNETLAVARKRLREKFGPLYRALRLTPDQISAFEENEAAYEAKQSDVQAALLQQRVDPVDPVASKLLGQLGDERDTAQKSVLGEAGYNAFHEFQRTAMVRDMISHVAGAATVTGFPLTPTQSEQLIQLLVAADHRYATGGWAGMDIDWDKATEAAQAILSPEQLALLRDNEPPMGGRFWSVLNNAVSNATRSEPASPAGG